MREPQITDVPGGAADNAAPAAVILFDGTCAFCEGAVRFIARRDPSVIVLPRRRLPSNCPNCRGLAPLECAEEADRRRRPAARA